MFLNVLSNVIWKAKFDIMKIIVGKVYLYDSLYMLLKENYFIQYVAVKVTII